MKVRIITFCVRSHTLLQQGLDLRSAKNKTAFPTHFKGLLLSSAHVKAVQFNSEDGRLRGAEPFINYLFVNTFIWMLFQAIVQRGGDLTPTLASPRKISLEFKCIFRYIIEICTVYIHI